MKGVGFDIVMVERSRINGLRGTICGRQGRGVGFGWQFGEAK